MVLQNSGRYKPEKGNPFSAGTSQGVGNSETSNLPGDDGKTDKRFETLKENLSKEDELIFSNVPITPAQIE